MSYALIAFLFLVMCTKSACNVHGGTFLAMAGKGTVVLLSDSRFSSQKTGSMLLGSYPRKTIRIGSRCLVGCFGLENDAWSLLYKLRGKFSDLDGDIVQPRSVARVVSDILYNNNFLLSPVVVGLGLNESPHICTMDGLGAQTVSDKFAVVGTASEGLLALCESLYQPGLEAPQLAELAERCFHLAMQRDVLSGCDFRLHTLTSEGIYVKNIKRLDV